VEGGKKKSWIETDPFPPFFFFQEQEIKTKKSIDDLRKQLTALILGHLDTWETQHHQLIMGFAGRFGAENMLVRAFLV
jgi:choline-phosphate cytidylyltransferase